MSGKFKIAEGRPRTISFRLDEDGLRVLCERAKVLGVSPHELSRIYTQEMLRQGEERVALRQAVSGLNESIHKLRSNLMLSTRAVLTSAGRVEEQDAEAWVQKVFAEI